MVGAPGHPDHEDHVELPDTLRGLVAARLDGLTTDERRVLDDCAVLGRRGPMMAIEVMAGKHLGIDDVRPVLESLEAKELLVLSGTGEGEKWTFRSDLVREVAYSTLTKGDRARSHFGIASWMEAHEDTDRDAVVDRITYHYVRAAELIHELGPVDGPARRTSPSGRCTGSSRRPPAPTRPRSPSWPSASTARGSGCSAGSTAPSTAPSSAGRARALAGLREIAPARADALAAVEESRQGGADALRDLGRSLLVLADIEQKASSWAASEDALDEAGRVFASLGDASGEAEVLRFRGFGALTRHEYAAATDLLEQALARYEALDDQRGRGLGPPEPGVVRLLLRPGGGGRGAAAQGRRHLRGDRRPGRPALGAGPAGLGALPAGPLRRGGGDGRSRSSPTTAASATGGPSA